ncbi:integral membrane protein, AcrB/AcrD/AcrF family (plasmid) [Legionella adelaidensis]|uniref:Integral membrane protein, AcrB/AcrD/AcrF family n=1 Tax=Legionella adelaidensis TaxID=45056 RepID=A0A0W0R1F4_9GAMM|nr:efflux RND transporter permease subunit [Legionella adelaidensis]KTC64928.1 integral membrane protein, AcrB/AcrD/AcrF family [Legionella adelaidensis]VEH85611.1 integral membrane protein, AcrB/AcrD/AcrF family [Legionella adelaidensis]
MKFADYFLKNPVSAIVLNSLLVILGMLCLFQLPLCEYPDVSLPVINVSTYYPNASAPLVESSVTNVLEEHLAGIEGLETITSRSNAGSSQITLNFLPVTSMDKAFNAVQEAVSNSKGLLPPEVKIPFIEKQKKNTGLPFIAIAVESNKESFGELTHFTTLNLKNQFRSIPGVSSVEVWGQPLSYQITLSPEKLYNYGINTSNIFEALISSKIALPAGSYQNKIPVTLQTELKTLEDYEDLRISTRGNSSVPLKAIAKITLENDQSTSRTRVNGNPGVVISINKANDANPLEVSREVTKMLQQLQESLPSSIKAQIILDQSEFIQSSLKNIKKAISEAIFLVVLIVFLFLRNFRATLIPIITIPISLLGALLFLRLFHYSLNLMTLLAMILAIGLVVDDAIVVLENIWRHIEEGIAPIKAAYKGVKEIGFAIISMTVTLASVYLPIVFINGVLGQIFIEFAVALAGSVLISGLVALTLSPLMCAKLLQMKENTIWPQFDNKFAVLTTKYVSSLEKIAGRKKIVLSVLFLSSFLSYELYSLIPQESAPKEDRGLMGLYLPSLSGEKLDDLDKKINAMEDKLHSIPEIQNRLTFIGDWGGTTIMPLKPHSQRHRSTSQVVEDTRPKLAQLPSVDPQLWSWDFGLPGTDALNNQSELSLNITTTEDFSRLLEHTNTLKMKLEESGKYTYVEHELRLDNIGYTIQIDQDQLAKLGLTTTQVAKTIEVFFSGDKSQTFEKDGINYNINVKGNVNPWSVDELYVFTPQGKPVSLGAICKMIPETMPEALTHYQQQHSTTLHVQPKAGTLASASVDLFHIAKSILPPYYKLSWNGSVKSFQESQHTMQLLILLSLIFIYAALSIQFSSFLDPLIILITVPLASTGALLLLYVFGQTLNIYSQIGLVTLIGLISKHGILLVEFANQQIQSGVSLKKAILAAAKIRLRPILMTTGAMVFGALPLALSHDAGYEGRRAIGMVLIGGLCWGTLFTLYILPGVYLMITSLKKNRSWARSELEV